MGGCICISYEPLGRVHMHMHLEREGRGSAAAGPSVAHQRRLHEYKAGEDREGSDEVAEVGRLVRREARRAHLYVYGDVYVYVYVYVYV